MVRNTKIPAHCTNAVHNLKNWLIQSRNTAACKPLLKLLMGHKFWIALKTDPWKTYLNLMGIK